MNHKNYLTSIKLLGIAIASVLLVMCSVRAYHGPNNMGCSHTFFRPRPFSQDQVLQLGLVRYENLYGAKSCASYSFDIMPFFYQSTNSCDLARYFLPGCRQCITVAQNNESDVSSPWLGLVNQENQFSSVYCLSPRRKAAGAAFRIYASGANIFDCDSWFNPLWASIFVPVVRVQHDLRPVERVQGGQGTAEGLQNVNQALNNPEWHSGIFPVCKQTKSGIDDIQFRLGYDLWRYECAGLGFYFVGFIPGGNESRACTVFEPTFGSGDHGGVGLGAYGDYLFWESCEQTLAFLFDVRYTYFMRSTEIRSFDLANGDWSRYMLLANQYTPQIAVPGINFLTMPVEVTPRSTVDAWFALHHQRCDWHFEVGYSFWFRQAERVCIPCDPFVQHVGIFDLPGLCQEAPVGTLTSASTATIRQGVVGEDNAPTSDETFTRLTIQDLNLSSGAHPRASSSKIYGAVAYDVCWDTLYGGMIGLGVSYEHAHKISALSQFGVWVKGSLSF